MSRSKFMNCQLEEVDFAEAKLEESCFQFSDLVRANFNRTNLYMADFRGANNYTIDPRINFIKQAIFSQPSVMSLLDSLDIRIEDIPTEETDT